MEDKGKPQKPTIWNKNYIFCMLVSAFASFAQSMLNPAMPVYGQEIGLNANIIGIITAIATLICMVGRGISGKYSDLMSKKRLVFIGLFITLSGYSLYFLADNVTIFSLARVLQTVGSGIQVTVLSALAISVVPEVCIPSAIAIFSVASSLAQCFAPNIGTNLAYGGSFTALFITAFVLVGVSVFLLSQIREKVTVRPAINIEEKKKWNLDRIICTPAIPAAILLLFNGIIYTCVTSYLSLYGLEKNLPNVGIFFTINAITMIAIRPIVGMICNRKSLAYVIIPGFAAELLTAVILASTAQMSFVCLAAVCYGIGFGSSQSAIQIMAVRSVGPERRGDANGTFYVGGDVGLAFGAYAGGFIFNLVGASMMYVFVATMAGVSILFYLGYKARTHSSKLPSKKAAKTESC